MNNKMSETSRNNIYNTITFGGPPSGRQRTAELRTSCRNCNFICVGSVWVQQQRWWSGAEDDKTGAHYISSSAPPPWPWPGPSVSPSPGRLRPAARPHQDNASPAKTEIARPGAAPWRQLCWRHGAGTYFTCYDNPGLLLRRYINRYD